MRRKSLSGIGCSASMTSSPLKNGNCIEAGLLCSDLRHLLEVRGGLNSGSERFGWRRAFACGALQSQHLPNQRLR